ncbi:MAG: cytochrome b5 domain-containing protein [Bacteroidota bacterium]
MIALATYNAEQLSMRNGLSGNDCWIAYKGNIYDVSASPLFKNGKHFKLYSGRDLTIEMPDAPHLEDVLDKFQIVGVLESIHPLCIH